MNKDIDIEEFLESVFNSERIYPLQRKLNVEYEVAYQLDYIVNEGCEVVSIFENKEKILILYRQFYDDTPKKEEPFIILNLKIITKEGILAPEPFLRAVFDKEYNNIDLADIDIKKPFINQSYGSILLGSLIDIAKKMNVDRITGWISEVDKDHIQRLVHFYKKHGFEVILKEDINHSKKIGDVIWINKESLK
ncbi:GNAT family N-acetyltransferase [Bacillus sp. JJ864]|uniref:GNAT family N-acetyltransferase n=1 Tax=Bacillus sp. JJ864 TaxID=3122975 RepID=UPI0030000686